MSRSDRDIGCVICRTIYSERRLFSVDIDGNTIELNQTRICKECIGEKNERVNYQFLGFKWKSLMTIV